MQSQDSLSQPCGQWREHAAALDSIRGNGPANGLRVRPLSCLSPLWEQAGVKKTEKADTWLMMLVAVPIIDP